MRSALFAMRTHLESDLLTVDETARYLRLSRTRTYTLISRGEIPAVKVGKRAIRVPRGALERWVYGAESAPSALAHDIGERTCG